MKNEIKVTYVIDKDSLKVCNPSLGDLVYVSDTSSIMIWDGTSWTDIGLAPICYEYNVDILSEDVPNDMSLFKSRYLIKNKIYDRSK